MIYSANTLSHIENFSEIFKAVYMSLNKEEVLVLEDPSLLECIKKVAYDQFYCEHIYVFSISLQKILDDYNLEILLLVLQLVRGSNRYFGKKKSNSFTRINKRKIFKLEKNLNSLHLENLQKVILSEKSSEIFSNLIKKKKK